VKSLKAALRYKERTAKEQFFGSSTSSAKLPVKANTEPPKSPKPRGAQPGHASHSRKAANPEDADRVVPVPSAHSACPGCGGHLERKDTRRRLVRECRPIESEDIVLELPVQRCTSCDRTVYTQAPGVFPVDRGVTSHHRSQGRASLGATSGHRDRGIWHHHVRPPRAAHVTGREAWRAWKRADKGGDMACARSEQGSAIRGTGPTGGLRPELRRPRGAYLGLRPSPR
jgi:hypothetical protein